MRHYGRWVGLKAHSGMHLRDCTATLAGPMIHQLLHRLQHPASAVGKLGLVRLGGSAGCLRRNQAG